VPAKRLHVKMRITKNVFMDEIIVIFEVKKKLPDRAIWKLILKVVRFYTKRRFCLGNESIGKVFKC
jgi:hypothetical protein